MKLVLYTFFVTVAIPFLTFSIDPKNPSDACERFIHEQDQKNCLKKVESKAIDWYASALCEKIDDDATFLSCFDFLSKAQFDPKAVSHCETVATEDQDKYKCLQVVGNKSLGNCGTKKDLTSLEVCMKAANGRLPADDKKFYQK
jgi:hypothetical protein